MSKKYGEQFQKNTKYYREKIVDKKPIWDLKPENYKEYPDVKKYTLPLDFDFKENFFTDVIEKRKSTRVFSGEPITLNELSYILKSCAGISRIENDFEYRICPSAGALYPIETYLCVNNVDNLPAGLYHYNVKHHELELIKTGKYGEDLSVAAIGQKMVMSSSVCFLWSAVFNRCRWKYGERSFRYIYLDAGHIGQNFTLACTDMDISSCMIAAYFDDEVNSLLSLNDDIESVIYMGVAGHEII